MGALLYVFIISYLRIWWCWQYHGGPLYYFLFYTRGFWQCRQYPEGPLYVFLYFISEGIGGVANTHGGPSYVFLLSNLRVLAVPPISRGPSNVYVFSYSMGIGGAANTREAPHMYLYFQTRGYWRTANTPGVLIRISTSIPKGYWRCRQYPAGPHTILSLLIAVFLEMIINLKHKNLSMISMNEDMHMWMQVVQSD